MKLGMVFTGQGSQFIGMLMPWSKNKTVCGVFKLASDVMNVDLEKLIHNGPKCLLDLTIFTQPITLAFDFSMFCLWKNLGGAMPILSAGHSLGEYAALTASKCFNIVDALRLVKIRAELIQKSANKRNGMMAVIFGLERDIVEKICKNLAKFNRVIEPASFNLYKQIVISGDKNAIEEACVDAKNMGGRSTILPISAPFHCSLLKSAAYLFGKELENIYIHPPEFRVISNVNLSDLTHSKQIKKLLIKQIYSPVRWLEIIHYFSSNGITHVIECGPKSTLSNMIRFVNPNIKTMCISCPKSLIKILNFITTESKKYEFV